MVTSKVRFYTHFLSVHRAPQKDCKSLIMIQMGEGELSSVFNLKKERNYKHIYAAFQI